VDLDHPHLGVDLARDLVHGDRYDPVPGHVDVTVGHGLA
jgi:hypothetical protein